MRLASLFKGKQDKKEEMKEAKAVKNGKISPKQYAKGEKMEGDKKSTKALVKTAEKMKSGKMSPAAYAKSQKNEK
jgi:hypothetical protein